MASINPRYANGNARRKIRARLKAESAPCGICKGKLGSIHYDEPSDSKHPLSFVVDEIIPISKSKQFGYASKTQAALDYNNVQAAHYICNAMKGDKLGYHITDGMQKKRTLARPSDGEW